MMRDSISTFLILTLILTSALPLSGTLAFANSGGINSQGFSTGEPNYSRGGGAQANVEIRTVLPDGSIGKISRETVRIETKESTFETRLGTQAENARTSPRALVSYYDNVRYEFERGTRSSAAIHFGLQAYSLYFAMGALALFECTKKIAKNPMACADFGNQLKDPLAHVALGGFMAANHGVTHLLTSGKTKVAPGYVKYVGLAAGALVAGFSYEFLSDPNVKYVATNLLDVANGTDIDRERLHAAFEQVYTKWMNPANLSAYAPAVFSLASSVFLFVNGLNLTAHFLAGSGFIGRNVVLNGVRKGVVNSGKKVLNTVGVRTIQFVSRIKYVRNVVAMTGPQILGLIPLLWLEHKISPYVRPAFAKQDTGAKLKFYESEIQKLLTEGVSNGSLDPLNEVGFFLYDNIHEPEMVLKQQEEAIKRASDTLAETDINGLLDGIASLEGASFYFDNRSYNHDFSPSIMQMPYLISLRERNLTQNFSPTLPIGDEETVFDELLDKLGKHHQEMQKYISALGLIAEETMNNWGRFMERFSFQKEVSFHLYRQMIESKGKDLFRNDMSRKRSQAVVESLYFGNRDIPSIEGTSTSRLENENKLSSWGVASKRMMSLNDDELEWLKSHLNRQRTILGVNVGRVGFRGGRFQDAVIFVNQGFDVRGLYSLSHETRQLMSTLAFFGLDQDRISMLSTDELERVKELFENIESWNYEVYQVAFNNGALINDLLSMSASELVNSMGGYQIVDVYIEEAQKPGADTEFDFLEFVPADFVSKEDFEHLVYSFLCGREATDSAILRDTMSGLAFEAPRVNQAPGPCYRKEQLHNPLWGVAGQEVEGRETARNRGEIPRYQGVVDYALNSMGTVTTEYFDKEWWPYIDQRAGSLAQTYSDRKEKAFKEKLAKNFKDESYGNFIDWGNLLHPVLFGRTLSSLNTIEYADGIENAIRDAVDYYLRVLVMVVPQDDPEFLSSVYEYIDRVVLLSRHSGRKYQEIRPMFSMAEGLALEELSVEELSSLSDPGSENALYYRAVSRLVLNGLQNEIVNQSLRMSQTNEEQQALHTITRSLLSIVEFNLMKLVYYSEILESE